MTIHKKDWRKKKRYLIDTFKISGQSYHLPVGEIDLKTVGEKANGF